MENKALAGPLCPELLEEITTLKDREKKLVEVVKLVDMSSYMPRKGKISYELLKERAREVLKELGVKV